MKKCSGYELIISKYLKSMDYRLNELNLAQIFACFKYNEYLW